MLRTVLILHCSDKWKLSLLEWFLGFTDYLLSDDCDVFDPDQNNIVQDMNQPLSHYFIASSHNT